MMNHTDDIVLEILLRLPVKSLLRFKCVCKEWCFLIKSTHFIHMHLAFRRAREVKHLIATRFETPSDDDAVQKLVINYYDDFKSLSVLTSPPDFEFELQEDPYNPSTTLFLFSTYVNGIVCLTEYGSHNVHLLNPALREFETLPDRPFGCPSGLHCTTIGIGFGLDDTTNDYKVVRIVEYDNGKSYDPDIYYSQVEVYSLRTNSWKALGNTPHRYINPHYSSIFFNGCVHWLATSHCGDQEDFILAFNLRTELIHEEQLPQELTDYEWGRYKTLFVIDEATIALVACTWPSAPGDEDDVVNVWVMKEYGVKESWIKRYSIIPFSRIEKPLFFWEKDILVLVTTDGELVYYDLPTGKLHRLRKYDPMIGPFSVLYTVRMVICNESLLSIQQIDEQENPMPKAEGNHGRYCSNGMTNNVSFMLSRAHQR